MGVDNLMGFVKLATTQTQITRTDLPNSTAAIDVSHWIYKASYGIPEALYHRTNVNQIYSAITSYIGTYVKLLKSHNVQMTFVFDGMKLPAKDVTHRERSARKAEARRLVQKFLAANNPQEARKHMLRCIDVKFDIVQQVIHYCKQENINYIVAPYEADAQLAFLNNNGHCEFIITEDTDLILYGCQKIIYKLDRETGECVLYQRSRLGRCLQTREELEFEKFRRICIMSGCDYLKNIPNVGLQTAKKFFLLTKQNNIRLALPKLAANLNNPKLKGKVTEEYINGFIDAETTFKHHIVYDPVHQKLRPLEPYPRGKSSSDFPMAGKRFHSTLAKELVQGKIDLDTLDPSNDLDSASDASDTEIDDDASSTTMENREVPQKRIRA
uniref:Exonuclease 1 n=1 Tax=Aceria tosichella TaxID=561515 RepID=A0A6G1S7Y5_9ACAR